MAKSKNKTIYVCQNCGAQRPRWEGRCSDCGAWNSLVEETFSPEPVTRGWATAKSEKPTGGGPIVSTKPIALDQSIEAIEFKRMDTGYGELNRVLGGGLAQGSFVLLGGSPGIGKSTLLMQMAGGLAKHKSRVLYISGEESIGQTGSRAQRLGIRSALVEVASESNLRTILDLARDKRPEVVVVDSIQTIFLPELEAAPGSVSQVRECAGHLMGLAKTDGMTVILIGHVTKDGSIAGPKVLEHMVDCVLSFEGDMSQNFRLLRALKNRFGATHELGVFQMVSSGLEEVTNPSELFLEERGDSLIGSAVFASMEGSRPLLCEVQALTLGSPMAMPRRTALGIETNRLHLLSAVLDRHLEMKLNHADIFINVVGGLKLNEPSSDLAVAAAILSTELNRELEAKAIFFGEIGLTGEVRAASYAELRLREADKLGFDHFVIPASNKKHLSDFQVSKGKRITWIRNVQELSKLIHGGERK
jgi:DNA repair protein RadA/Sms